MLNPTTSIKIIGDEIDKRNYNHDVVASDKLEIPLPSKEGLEKERLPGNITPLEKEQEIIAVTTVLRDLCHPGASNSDKVGLEETIPPRDVAFLKKENLKIIKVSEALRGLRKTLMATILPATAVVVAAIATVLTGGATSPFLILACVQLAVALGDIGCEYYNFKQSKSGKDELSTGNDCLAFLVNKIFVLLKLPEKQAAIASAVISVIIRGILAFLPSFSLFSVPSTVGGLATAALNVLNYALKCTQIVTEGCDAGREASLAQAAAKCQAEIECAQREEEANRLKRAERAESNSELIETLLGACHHILKEASATRRHRAYTYA
ncbi:hypothetical protein SK355_10730 [Candidatus Fukatsuia symbiotica]|uniref:Uncharacterized protein n=1 Tax=Candidatus Fukatsuia symbiotica TaxID=1878942 RepID=A0A2U8I4B3_9GAMM|nr:hypothetical protein [Candidatus Fukatsuia symbiotica]AWK13990.1 hypothetical protein CCS41_05040 [Candidatus Fukatsuia symbiotica]MEA9445665.1 hypothetical protein [Candidatus Fukatsuia symbiotica]